MSLVSAVADAWLDADDFDPNPVALLDASALALALADPPAFENALDFALEVAWDDPPALAEELASE